MQTCLVVSGLKCDVVLYAFLWSVECFTFRVVQIDLFAYNCSKLCVMTFKLYFSMLNINSVHLTFAMV